MDDFLSEIFVIYKEELLDLCQELEGFCIILEADNSEDKEDLKKGVLRNLHTIKGNSASIGLKNTSEKVHSLESKLVNSLNWVSDNSIVEILNLCDFFSRMVQAEYSIERIESEIKKLDNAKIVNRVPDIQTIALEEVDHGIDPITMPDLSSKRVFIIDDNEDVLEIYMSLFSEFKIKSLEGYLDPWKALNRISKGYDPDLVILDFNMPMMNGLRFANRLRKNVPEVKIILISGHISGKDVIEFPLTVVDYYLEKPVELKDIINALRNIA